MQERGEKKKLGKFWFNFSIDLTFQKAAVEHRLLQNITLLFKNSKKLHRLSVSFTK